MSMHLPKRLRALQALPEGYHETRRIGIDSLRIAALLNLYGVALMVGGLFIFSRYNDALRLTQPTGFNPIQGLPALVSVLLTLIAFVTMLGVHELLHGAAFWWFGARPRFGINLGKGVAYAAAEHYFLPRNAYLVVAVAPLLGITLGSLALMLLVGGETRVLIGVLAAANIGGSVGDLWFVLVCRRYDSTLLVRDFGDGAALYTKAATPHP